MVQSACVPLSLLTPPSSGCPGLILSEAQQQGGQTGLLDSTPPPRVFHLLFQTNMKLLPQIKGESASIIPYSLTNGVGRPAVGRENCGVWRLPPVVHRPKCTSTETPPTSHGPWLVVGLERQSLSGRRAQGLYQTRTWGENVYPSSWKTACFFVLF